MKSKETYNPYFDLYRGNIIRYSDILTAVPATRSAVEVLFASQEVIGQFTLDEDLVLWMPRKITFDGILPPKRCQVYPMPRWEKDFIETEKMMLGRK